MVTTSDAPITVDGVRLDTLAWNIQKITRATASRRSADVTVPGGDGSFPSLNDPLEPATFGLDMFVKGTNADGQVPAGSTSRRTFRDNLDELVHLFGKRHALVEVTDTLATGNVRRCLAKVTDAITPELNEPGSAGTFTVAMTIPAGVWEDVATQDWTSGAIANGVAQEVTTLAGATERNTDAVLLVTGPITNPRVTDPATGAYVQLNQALSATQFWRVNLGTWATMYGASLGLGSADTTGSEGAPHTIYGGARGVVSFCTLQPVRTSVADKTRRTSLALSGNGITTATRLSVRARRKFAL